MKPSNYGRRLVQHNDVLGFWHIPNHRVMCPTSMDETSKPYFIQTNSIGIRDTREFTLSIPSSHQRVILMGDSFAFGAGLNVESSFGHILESKTSTEIMNFSLRSSGIDQQYLIYKQIASNYEADTLLLAPYINNIARSSKINTYYQDHNGNHFEVPRPYFTLENGTLNLENVPVPKPFKVDKTGSSDFSYELSSNSFSKLYGKVRNQSFLNKLLLKVSSTKLKYHFARYLPDLYPEYDGQSQIWNLGKAILNEFIESSKQENIVIAPLPPWSVIMKKGRPKYLDRFFELHNPSNGVHVIDLHKYFRRLKFRNKIECFISPKDPHYSCYGNTVVAMALLREMKSLGLLGARSK